jgi:mono/diheme cytochrome c family protein
MSRSKRSVLLAAASILGFHLTPALPFTTEQAAAGRASYEQHCVACHGADLQVLRTAQLMGPEFLARWRNRNTSELLAQLRATMPPDNVGGLPEDTYLGVIAYILQLNGSAPSAQPLTAAAAAAIGAGGSATAAGGSAEAQQTGVIVAGRVQNFVPIAEQTLRGEHSTRAISANTTSKIRFPYWR